MTTVHAKIEIESCDECPYSKRDINQRYMTCTKAARFIDWLDEQAGIPDWCPLLDKDTCPGCDQPHHTCLCTHDSDDGC